MWCAEKAVGCVSGWEFSWTADEVVVAVSVGIEMI
jgi:hypothetical protein